MTVSSEDPRRETSETRHFTGAQAQKKLGAEPGRRRRDEPGVPSAAGFARDNDAIAGLAPLATGLASGSTVPGTQLKLDELMFKFLSHEGHHGVLSRLVDDFEAGLELPASAVRSLSSPVLSPRAGAAGGPRAGAFSPPRSPRSPASPRSSPMSSPRASPRARSPRAGFAQLAPRAISGKTSAASPESNGPAFAPPTNASGSETKTSDASPEQQTPTSSLFQNAQHIPPLRLPQSRPLVSPKDLSAELLSEADRYFDCAENESIAKNDFVSICKGLCNFPTFLNESLCRRILEVSSSQTQQERSETDDEGKDASESKRDGNEEETKRGPQGGNADGCDDDAVISKSQFLEFWAREMEPFDEHDRFFRLLKPMHRDYIVSEDLLPHLEELLAYHPGLEFLESTPEFQEKYARTVAARIMFRVNTSRSGRISRREFRHSDLLDVCHQVDEEEDINLVFKYFNYEGFYVCYVKFWELDTDHDFLLSKEDLMRHGGHALVPKIVDRIFEQPVYPFMSGDAEGRMGYEDFVYFFLAEEDKSNEASIRYWFDCVDLDGDGVIRPWEMKAFYNEQLTRLQSYGHEAISFADVLCQAHDFVHPRTEGAFVLADFCKPDVIKISGMMFNILFNMTKFIAFEQRDPHWIRAQHENPDFTDWDRFVAVEYARLASAEEEREIEEEAGWTTDGYSDFDQDQDRDQSWQYSGESPF